MSEQIPPPAQAQQPGVITYVEHHQGQRRRLTLNLTQVASMLLPPGDQSRTFTYETRYGTGSGILVETA